MDATASRDIRATVQRIVAKLDEQHDSTDELPPVSEHEAAEVLERLSAASSRR